MDLGLKEMRALVLASSQGLGAATAAQLALEGAKVAINGRDPAKLANTQAAMRQSTQGEIIAIPGDVTRADDARRVVEETARQFGGIDILVTNAGGPPAASFDKLSADDWKQAYDLLVMSVVYTLQAALPILRLAEKPAILAITSISTKQPVEGLILSNSVRMAVAGLVKTLADELGPQGIRVNAILPGLTRTERMTYLIKNRAESANISAQEVIKNQTAGIPLKRLGEPDEFGRVAAFLVSPAASFIHGAMIPVDGGQLRATL
jgi:3-oxoacyl-[acyl-carrier protein] reductase